MRDKPAHNLTPVTCVLLILALPVLYGVTFPPLLILPKWRYALGSGCIHGHPYHPWMRPYVKPWIYLENETSIGDSLDAYLTWWEHKLRP